MSVCGIKISFCYQLPQIVICPTYLGKAIFAYIQQMVIKIQILDFNFIPFFIIECFYACTLIFGTDNRLSVHSEEPEELILFFLVVLKLYHRISGILT